MFCVYNHRVTPLVLSALFHLGLLVSASRYASYLDWQPAAGNRGSVEGATEVALWTKPQTTPTKKRTAPTNASLPVENSKRSASSSIAEEPARVSAAQGIGAGGNNTSYRAILHALLDSSKTYPPSLRELQISGVVHVRFRVTRDGHLDDLQVIEKETAAPLRNEAMRFLKRVERVPIPPEGLSDDQLHFELPLRYEARGS